LIGGGIPLLKEGEGNNFPLHSLITFMDNPKKAGEACGEKRRRQIGG